MKQRNYMEKTRSTSVDCMYDYDICRMRRRFSQ